MPYTPHTAQEREKMLQAIGMSRADLFADIPEGLGTTPHIPAGLSELETFNAIDGLAGRNNSPELSFLGGGFYDHFIPASVGALTGRSEFYTAYTPYQPECSQGTLQAIFEYQSSLCRLMNMDVANASLYDGGTAIFEAAMMAMRITARSTLLVDESVNPLYRRMLDTYTANLDAKIVIIPSVDGGLDRETLGAKLDDSVAAVIVANPNFFGTVDDFTDIAKNAHACGAMLVVSVYPVSLGILKTPGEMDADIAVGEGQSLGMPLSFGGPYLGLMAARKAHVRKMPGRIVGRTVDAKGREGFVLTLQAREQHIRREKATSNICTNQGLCALTSLIYLSVLGKGGFTDLARLCGDRAKLAADKLAAIKGTKLTFPKATFFNEFVLELPRPASQVTGELLERGIAPGIDLGKYYKGMDNSLLVAVTEKNSIEDIDRLVKAMEGVL